MTVADSPARRSPGDVGQQPISRSAEDVCSPVEDSRLARFLTQGEQRRTTHTRDISDRPNDWAHPDPAAILDPPIGADPITRIRRRRRTEGIIDDARRLCALLQDVAPRSLGHDQVRAYPWHHVTAEAASDYRRAIYARYTLKSTRNNYMSSLRVIVIECHRAGLISPLRRDLVLEQLYTHAPDPSTNRRRLSAADIATLLAFCEKLPDPRAVARDTCIVALLYTTGMRVGELAKLRVDDFDPEHETLLLRETKNGHNHTVFLHPQALAYLTRWLKVRGEAPGALITALTGDDVTQVHRATIRWALQTRGRAAGLGHFTAHDFRRTFATELLRTHDPSLVGKLMNHRKLSSTMVYDLASDDEQRHAVALLDLPAPAAATPASPTPTRVVDAA